MEYAGSVNFPISGIPAEFRTAPVIFEPLNTFLPFSQLDPVTETCLDADQRFQAFFVCCWQPAES
jgi:hypothetical protein